MLTVFAPMADSAKALSAPGLRGSLRHRPQACAGKGETVANRAAFTYDEALIFGDADCAYDGRHE